MEFNVLNLYRDSPEASLRTSKRPSKRPYAAMIHLRKPRMYRTTPTQVINQAFLLLYLFVVLAVIHRYCWLGESIWDTGRVGGPRRTLNTRLIRSKTTRFTRPCQMRSSTQPWPMAGLEAQIIFQATVSEVAASRLSDV